MPDYSPRPSVTGEQTPYGDLLDFLIPLPWHADGACKEYPGVDFFDESKRAVSEALEVCDGCLVRDECRAWALQQEGRLYGIWGDTTEGQRRRMQRGEAA